MKKLYITFLLLVIFLIPTAPVHAQGFYMDLGLEFIDLGDQLSNVDMGIGLGLGLGLDFGNGLALNMGMGSSVHRQNGVDLNYSRFWIGPRMTFISGGAMPYVEGGFMFHYMQWDYLLASIDGNGLYIRTGVDLPLAAGGKVGGYLAYSDWSGEENTGYNGSATTTAIGVKFTFGY